MKIVVRHTLQSRQKVVAWIIMMPLFIDVFNVFINQFLNGKASAVTALFYIVSLLCTIVVCGIRKRSLLLLMLIYLIVGTCYFLAQDTQQFYLRDNMRIMLLFMFPYCVISIPSIDDWNNFIERIFAPLAAVAVYFAGLMLATTNYSKYLVYMDFSYALLPAVCSLYYASRATNQHASAFRRYRYFFTFLLGLIEMFAFGSRACVLYSIMFILLFELIKSDISPSRRICIAISLILAAAIVVHLNTAILSMLNNLSIFKNSYVLNKLNKGLLFQSKGRDALYACVLVGIRKVGFNINGFFADRLFLAEHGFGYSYPHNFFYEILLTFGWLVGGIILLMYIQLYIKALRNKENRLLTLWVLVCLLGRYWVSGSYLVEGKFWIAIFMLHMIACKTNENKRIIYE